MLPRVLLVDDEPAIARSLAFALRQDGFDVDCVALAGDALTAVNAQCYCAIVLDVGLPDQTGFELCKTLRRGTSAPILFLSARTDEVDRVRGLELGDDYVTKPFSPREVVVRVRNLVRRTTVKDEPVSAQVPIAEPAAEAASEITLGQLHWRPNRADITWGATSLALTKSEYLLLSSMMANPGRVFSRAELLERMSDEPSASMERTIDAHVKSLRAKLVAAGGDGAQIETHRGHGYSLDVERQSRSR
jgi:two-component system, OmpR family, catabolic regulation response regulator CreB